MIDKIEPEVKERLLRAAKLLDDAQYIDDIREFIKLFPNKSLRQAYVIEYYDDSYLHQRMLPRLAETIINNIANCKQEITDRWCKLDGLLYKDIENVCICIEVYELVPEYRTSITIWTGYNYVN